MCHIRSTAVRVCLVVVNDEVVDTPVNIRFRTTREQLERRYGLVPETQCQNLALTVLHVPRLLDCGEGIASPSSAMKSLMSPSDNFDLLPLESFVGPPELDGSDSGPRTPRISTRQSGTAVELIWHTKDSQGQILALAFRSKASKASKLSPERVAWNGGVPLEEC